ncbi:hypothetical protein E4U17_004208 [Claviceps sp. LM77 group G4]|nr:hypothetical protein E4U17_004208 [Claviceps sp. LM77 group G4]KAG6069620.1 hypothetical protein E4U33_004710 [Claviceps sp. LM78 group G4]KAG6072566.1 hypothetical protein E4U16_005262 [Claviceps sp. LM84 group G4]
MALTTKGPIDRFFQRYLQFEYDPNAPVWAEYERMSETFRYTKGNKKDLKARTLLWQAIMVEFRAIDDEDEKQLAGLRRLCHRLDIFPLPNSVRYRDDMKALAMRRIVSDAIARTAGPIDRFFNRYSQFCYDPRSNVWSEFHRMCDFFGWDKGSKKEEKVGKLLRQALVDEFEDIDDRNENDLAVLQRLCQRLDIFPLPKSVRYRDDMKALATGDKAGDALVRTASPLVRTASPIVKTTGPMDLFFSRYSQFDYNPRSQVWSEYDRLCEYFRWDKGSLTEKTARKLFRQALVDEFGAIYGVDDNKLNVLQRLCKRLEIHPLPRRITDCKKAIKGVYVNIVDFVDCERTGKPIPKFDHLEQLQDYSIETGKIFPMEEAKDSLLLRFLLQRIFVERPPVLRVPYGAHIYNYI